MRNILSSANCSILEEFVSSNVLLAFHHDGTLAPIVDDPGEAELRQRTRALLCEVADLYPIVVISGRSQRDAARKLRGIGVVEVIGNHGIEPRHASARHVAAVRRWVSVLEQELADLRGVAIENKQYSVAVHYRNSREKKRARAMILGVAASLGNVRVLRGKQVVNILPIDAPHKGIALERERERLGCDTAVYVGDDQTDEDVFALDQPGRLLTIRVGTSQTSAATYFIPSQREIDELLRVLVRFRRGLQASKRAQR
jgi:trehalose 6-phosphate phosphatase